MHIELSNVTKEYDSQLALREVSLSIEASQIVAVLGANGAGKTTMLRLLAGLVGPSSGELRYDHQIFSRGRMDLRRRFLFLADYPAVFETWTPLQHIGMVLRLYDRSDAGLPEKVTELLSSFDLLAVADAPFFALSRGQRYKAALVALLAVDPELWLLDEPFASGMDPHGLSEFKKRARSAASQGRTILYSTQIADAAERFSDRICVLHRGAVHAYQAPGEFHKPSGTGDSALEAIFEKLREEGNS